VSKTFFINAFIQQECIKLIKSENKDIMLQKISITNKDSSKNSNLKKCIMVSIVSQLIIQYVS